MPPAGVVSRIEVTSYAHSSTELLGVQIDAAINSGNSGAHCRGAPTCRSCSAPCSAPAIDAHEDEDAQCPMGRVAPVAGGPVFNQAGQCVGIAFQSLSGGDAENIGWAHCAAFATYFALVRRPQHCCHEV